MIAPQSDNPTLPTRVDALRRQWRNALAEIAPDAARVIERVIDRFDPADGATVQVESDANGNWRVGVCARDRPGMLALVSRHPDRARLGNRQRRYLHRQAPAKRARLPQRTQRRPTRADAARIRSPTAQRPTHAPDSRADARPSPPWYLTSARRPPNRIGTP